MTTHDIDIELPAEFRSGNDIPVTQATIKRERMEEIMRDAIEADHKQSDTRSSRSVEQLKEALLNRNQRFVATHSEVKNLIEYYEAGRKQVSDLISKYQEKVRHWKPRTILLSLTWTNSSAGVSRWRTVYCARTLTASG